MKKLFILFTSILGICQLNAQTIAAKLQYKAGPDSFYVSIIPTFTDGSFNMSNSQLTIVFSNNYAITAPASSSIATTAVNGGAWIAQDFALETLAPNKRYVGFSTTGATVSLSAGTPLLMFRFRVTGAGGNCIGGLGLSRVYANGIDLTDPSGGGGDFSSVINGNATDYFTTNTSVTLQTCTQLILPVHILEFNARRDGNDGILEWSAIGEEFNSDYYELERSIDGSSFQSIAHIDCRKLTGVQKYQYTDQNISNLNSKYVYYRVKQFDLDDKFTVSGIRQLKMDISDKGIAMYPNPVKSGFYLNVPFTNPNQGKVVLTIMNGVGQPVSTKEITSQQATNYYYDLRNARLAAGDYYLKIVHDGQVLDIKKFLISKE